MTNCYVKGQRFQWIGHFEKRILEENQKQTADIWDTTRQREIKIYRLEGKDLGPRKLEDTGGG